MRKSRGREGGLCSSLERHIVDMDQFGVPITLNCSGQSHFKSVTGGICSFILAIIIFQFAILKVHSLLNDVKWRFFRVASPPD